MFVIGANTIDGAIDLYVIVYIFTLMYILIVSLYWEQEETNDGETYAR